MAGTHDEEGNSMLITESVAGGMVLSMVGKNHAIWGQSAKDHGIVLRDFQIPYIQAR